jgi:uncharacterized protein
MALAYHEPPTELSAEARDIHRALSSTIEELEAVAWYHQRAEVCADEGLKAILLHNRDEEIEHAAMGLEWLRRRIPKFDEQLRTYLFTSGPIHALEEEVTGVTGGTDPPKDVYSGMGIGKFTK